MYFCRLYEGRLNTGGVKTDVKSAVIEMPVQAKRHSTDRWEGRGIMGDFKNIIASLKNTPLRWLYLYDKNKKTFNVLECCAMPRVCDPKLTFYHSLHFHCLGFAFQWP